MRNETWEHEQTCSSKSHASILSSTFYWHESFSQPKMDDSSMVAVFPIISPSICLYCFACQSWFSRCFFGSLRRSPLWWLRSPRLWFIISGFGTPSFTISSGVLLFLMAHSQFQTNPLWCQSTEKFNYFNDLEQILSQNGYGKSLNLINKIY